MTQLALSTIRLRGPDSSQMAAIPTWARRPSRGFDCVSLAAQAPDKMEEEAIRKQAENCFRASVSCDCEGRRSSAWKGNKERSQEPLLDLASTVWGVTDFVVDFN